MNLLQIAGHLGKDPETRFTPSGQKVTTFSVAVNYRKGGKEESTLWVRVTIWGERFDKLISYLKKGSAVIVVGEMHPPAVYTDKEGRPQVSVEMTADVIRFSPFGKGDREESQSSHNTQTQTQSSHQEPYASAGNTYGRGGLTNGYGQQSQEKSSNDDDLPF